MTTPALDAAGRMPAVRKLRLLARIWTLAAATQIALWRHPLPVVVARFEALGTQPGLPLRTLVRGIHRGLRIGPWRPRCLLRSLVLFQLLREQGEPAVLVIGLGHEARTSDAHAWVELAGHDVGPPPGGAGYLELARFPRPVPGASGLASSVDR